MNKYYKLEGKKVIPCSLEEWAIWFETADRKIARTEIGEVSISTIFLGSDYSFGDGPIQIFETMIFGGEHDQWQDRYSKYDEAIQGHKNALELLISKTGNQ